VTKFRQNRLTLKGRSAGQRHTDTHTQTDRQTDKLGLKLGSFRFAIRPIELLLHYNHFTALFPPGEPVPEENFWALWDKNITSASAMQGGHNKHYSQLYYSYKTVYWPDLNKSLGHCHSGRFKYDNVGASNAKVPACTTGNLQNKTFSCHHATHYVSWNLVDCCITVQAIAFEKAWRVPSRALKVIGDGTIQ